jgi:hypothetical protein
MRVLFQSLRFCVLSLPLSAIAEEPSRFEFFGGYSLIHANIATNVPFASPSHENASGFNVSAAGYFNRWLGAVADFSGHFRNQPVSFNDPFSGQRVTGNIGADVFPLQFGPQVRFPGNRIRPFTRVMFGLFRIKTIAPNFTALDNDFGFSVGGGVDVRATDHVGVRIGQADYIRSHLTPTDWQNNWRFSAGLVFDF